MKLRPAKPGDAQEISKLMAQLGYQASSILIRTKLLAFSKVSIDEVFVADIDGTIVGVVSCHITSLFHEKGSSGRITSLVIDQKHRGTGVGKSLMREAELFFTSSDCVKSEVTSGEHRPEAHTFYTSCGYEQDERRFIKLYR